jgi:hypothetical protein
VQDLIDNAIVDITSHKYWLVHYFPRYEDGSNTFVKETYHTNIINRIKENTQMGPKGVGINACIALTGYITYVQDISKERYQQVLDVLPSLSEKMCKWLQCVSVYCNVLGVLYSRWNFIAIQKSIHYS